MTYDKNALREILKNTFGYESLRLQQENIIDAVLRGQDCVGVMPTGGGKSLCYQLPALYSQKISLVISPLISLMKDQVANLEQLGIPAAFINSSLSFEERKEVEQQLQAGSLQLLFMAPEGILHAPTLAFLRSLGRVGLIAIDEAHCVSQWGHEFRSDYTRLFELRSYFPKVPFLALTATADEQTRTDICRQLQLQDPQIFVSGFDRSNITYRIEERLEEISQLRQFIDKNHRQHTGIVYCLSRKKVENVAEKLQSLGYKAVAYHAGLTAKQRNRAQERFKSEDGLIVVATIAFGMGIDRPDVRYVAHLDLPKSIEGYYQETGRAGRDGLAAEAWMIYGLSDVVKHTRMLETSEADLQYKQAARKKLDAMLGLCETNRCRRRYLLEYFGEDLGKDCGNCDSCLHPVQTYSATTEAQKLLSAIYRTGQMYGAGHVIDVLRGSKNAKIQNLKHDQLSVYGIGKDLQRNEWNAILRQLLHLGYVYIKDYEFRSLALTQKARELFRGETDLQLRKRSIRAKSETINPSKGLEEKDYADHGQDDLFEALRRLRKKLAEERGVPPYMIFSDKSLHDMCHLLPEDKFSMLSVHGVGQSKYEKFGNEFLSEIIHHKLSYPS